MKCIDKNRRSHMPGDTPILSRRRFSGRLGAIDAPAIATDRR